MRRALRSTPGGVSRPARRAAFSRPRPRPQSGQPAQRSELRRTEPPVDSGGDFQLTGDRGLAASWRERALDNLAAIRLAHQLGQEGRPATCEEQRRLIRFTGFGASDLANTCFLRPGESGLRPGWEAIGADLRAAVAAEEYAALARCTQYARYTPEWLVRSIWRSLIQMGFQGGRFLEPGLGTGLFLALMPEAVRKRSRATGIELDPVTAGIARLLYPQQDIRNADFAKTELPRSFDLAIGNPPFSDRIVQSDPAYKGMGLRLHDYFIVKAIAALRPGGLAAFVTSHGTMDKRETGTRERISASADLLAAIRLPEGAFRATAGTDVVTDVLFFQKRDASEPYRGQPWDGLTTLASATGEIAINRYFAEHPEMVLGEHQLRRGIYGPALTYSCAPRSGSDTEAELSHIVKALTPELLQRPPSFTEAVQDDLRADNQPADNQPAENKPIERVGTAANGALQLKEEQLLHRRDGRLDADRGRHGGAGAGQEHPPGSGHSAESTPASSAASSRSATRCGKSCARRRPTSPGSARNSVCASPTRRSRAISVRSISPPSPRRPMPRPRRGAARTFIAARTSRRFSTIPIAGSSPLDRGI